MNKEKYFNERINTLKNWMSEQGINLTILSKPENTFYYSSFNPILYSHPVYVIVSLVTNPILLIYSLRKNHAKEEAVIKNIQLYGKWGNDVGISMDPIDAISEIIQELNINHINLALELSDISYNIYNRMMSNIGGINSITDITNKIKEFRMIKDDFEIDLLRKSAKIADIGMDTIIKSISNGVSEAEACTNAQHEMRKKWQKDFHQHEISGFGTSEGGIVDALNAWCLSGTRLSHGCDCPINYIPSENEFIEAFVWSKLGGYHIENERTMFIKNLDETKTKAFNTIINARERLFDILKPGITFDYLYKEAANIYNINGFGNLLPGRIGHGIGLSAHEFPSIAMDNKIVLKKGMVFTIEPGLLSKNWGNVAHSDTILVTKDGFDFLTKTRRDIIKL